MQFPGSLISKLPAVGTTIFTVMSKLAAEHHAINLSQGFPDFSCNPELIFLVEKYLKAGYNQYAPMPGVMALREVIAAKNEKLYGAVYDPDTEVTITAGGTQGIYTAIAATIREDDEVIIFEPAYDSYSPAIEMAGGKPVYIQLAPPEYRINWKDVQKLINHRTRMIIINTPHNPTGMVMDAEDMKMLEKLTRNTDIIIVSDEVYEHIIFDGHAHESVARYKSLAERSFVISSFGKTFHTTGWKVGYCLAPKNLMAEFRKVHQFMVFSVNTPIQHAYAEYLKEESNYLLLNDFYQAKRNHFISLIKGSRFKFTPSAGTYFQLLSYEGMWTEKDTELAVRLTKEKKIASVPVSVFYHIPQDHSVLRFCFAKSEETLEAAGKIISAL